MQVIFYHYKVQIIISMGVSASDRIVPCLDTQPHWPPVIAKMATVNGTEERHAKIYFEFKNILFLLRLSLLFLTLCRKSYCTYSIFCSKYSFKI